MNLKKGFSFTYVWQTTKFLMKDIHLPTPAPKNHHPQVSVWPFQEGFFESLILSSYLFLLLVLLLSDAGCDVTFRSISQSLSLSLLLILTRVFVLGKEIYYT